MPGISLMKDSSPDVLNYSKNAQNSFTYLTMSPSCPPLGRPIIGKSLKTWEGFSA